MYTGTKLAHACRFSEALEKQVFCIKEQGLEQILHRLGVVLNPHFHNINSLTWYLSKTHKKSYGKTLRFTRNSESKKEFFSKHPQVDFI